jgi:hypothetical protein
MSAVKQLETAGEVLSPAVRAVIVALEARLARAEARIRELEARLGQDSTNSSRLPSADPPGTARPAAPATTTSPAPSARPGPGAQRLDSCRYAERLRRSHLPTGCLPTAHRAPHLNQPQEA